MIILDATLRDGGYYNKWDFRIDLVLRYLKAIEKAGVEAIEVGFRNPNKPELTFANVTDKFIKSQLYIPNIKYFGVMIDAKSSTPESIKNTFVREEESPINFVRVATYFDGVDHSESLLKTLKDLGYFTTCNLMQAADKSYSEIQECAKKIEKWKSVDVLYLADSLGGMDHDTVNYAFRAIRESWTGLTGFHGHNNKSNALSNSLEAINIGVDWIDGTVLGMGRGPGNTEIEYLLYELNKRDNMYFDLEQINKLILSDFEMMKEEYNWGPSLLYYIAAEYNIHPIYIQNVIQGTRVYSTDSVYHTENILKAIEFWKKIDTRMYSQDLYEEGLYGKSVPNPG